MGDRLSIVFPLYRAVISLMCSQEEINKARYSNFEHFINNNDGNDNTKNTEEAVCTPKSPIRPSPRFRWVVKSADTDSSMSKPPSFFF